MQSQFLVEVRPSKNQKRGVGEITAIQENDILYFRSTIPGIGPGLVVMRETTTVDRLGFALSPLLFVTLKSDGAVEKAEEFLKVLGLEQALKTVEGVLGMLGFKLDAIGENRYLVRKNDIAIGTKITLGNDEPDEKPGSDNNIRALTKPHAA